MAMNTSAQSLVGLITSANLRFVIPVYRCPYSWDEGVELYCDNKEAYERVYPFEADYQNKWIAEYGSGAEWDSLDEDKKSRHVVVRSEADYDNEDWEGIYQWIIDWFFRFRELALAANA